jgi:acid-sensing ion channel, other
MTLRFPRKTGLSVTTDEYPLKSSARQGQGLKLSLVKNHQIPRMDRCTLLSFAVHSPFELAASLDISELFEFNYGYDLEVLITPEIIGTDPDLRSYEPKARGCYFEGEKKLKYFKVYTRRNCEFECRSEYIRSETDFNCMPFYLLRNNSIDVCDHRHQHRINKKTFIFFRVDFKSVMENCECLDECDSISYKTEIVARSLTSYVNSTGKSNINDDFYFESEIEFKFKDVDVVPLRRYRQMTFSDFLAQSGGMLGLFAGISALSIIELFYFMSLRWMVNLWRWIMN